MEEVGRGSRSDKQKQAMSLAFFQFGLDTFIRVHHATHFAELIRSMNLVSKFPANCIAATIALIAGGAIAADAPEKEAHVTQIIKDVQLLPSGATAQPAALNDKVDENTGVKTGDESRSELTFADLTITRLSANTVFSFNKAGREVQLASGAILFRVPKNSGGGIIKTHAVTVGITGTTLIFEYSSLGRGTLTVLEGDAYLALVDHPDQSKRVRAGQMLDVPADADKIPAPVEVDLSEIMQKSPLIRDFPPLPSQDLIIAAINNQQASSSKETPVPRRKKSTASSSSKSSSGPPVYHGGPDPDDDDDVYHNLPPAGQGRWVNPNLYGGNSNPGSHGGHGTNKYPGQGNGQVNTSGSTPTPTPVKGTKLHTVPLGQYGNQSNTSSNSKLKGTRILKGKTSSNATPTPTPSKFLKNGHP
jgi:hypothetical protein